MPEKICQMLIDRNYIAEEDRELYTYAIFNFLFRYTPFAVIIPFCVLTHAILPGTLCTISFLFLRKYSGGFHCLTPLSCFISSSLLITSLSLAGKYLPFYRIYDIIFPLILLISFLLSPARTHNKTLSASEAKYYKKCYALRCLLFSVAYYGLGLLHLSRLSVCLLLAVLLVTILQLLSYVTVQCLE